MTTETEQVAASADDGDESNIGAVDTASATMALSGLMYGGGVRFTNVDIPVGVTIDDATLKLRTSGAACAERGNCKHSILGVAVNNPPKWSNLFKMSVATKTAAKTSWNVTTNQAANGMALHQINVKAIVQEIIDRAGWVSGDAMSFVVEVDSYGKLASLSINAYDGVPALAAILVVNYSTPTGVPKQLTLTSAGS